MTDLAQRLVDSLAPALRRIVRQDFDGSYRFDWNYVPRSRRGVPLANMNAHQKAALDALLRSALSPQGHAKASGVIELEPILGTVEESSFRDPEGHHLSLNFTIAPAGMSTTPAFFGANPATVPSGPRAGWRLLRDEEDVARQLMRSLSDTQKRGAILNARAPRDIITGADREIRLRSFEGLPAAQMNAAQRELLLRLVRVYVGNAAQPIAARELTKIENAGFERLYFGWAGAIEPRKPHYYRIHGPTILIEYDNTQNDANHIHSVWRSPGADFGEDLLRKHYAEAAHD